MPPITVALTVYNAERFLAEAVESVLAQTFTDFEFLALDDGSSDRSLAMLLAYQSKDDRLRVISRENRGQVPSLNELIPQAKGTYIARMDADDICLPRRLEQQIDFMRSNPDHAVVGGWTEYMNVSGLPIGVVETPCSHDEIDQAHLDIKCSICHSTAMIDRDVLIKVGGYRPDFAPAEDLDLWLRLAEIAKVANIPECVLRYRLHPSSLSELHGAKQRTNMVRACQSAWVRRHMDYGRSPLQGSHQPTTIP